MFAALLSEVRGVAAEGLRSVVVPPQSALMSDVQLQQMLKSVEESRKAAFAILRLMYKMHVRGPSLMLTLKCLIWKKITYSL